MDINIFSLIILLLLCPFSDHEREPGNDASTETLTFGVDVLLVPVDVDALHDLAMEGAGLTGEDSDAELDILHLGVTVGPTPVLVHVWVL